MIYVVICDIISLSLLWIICIYIYIHTYMIIWIPFNSLMWIVTWIEQLPRHFADTAELPLGPDQSLQLHASLAAMSVEALNSLAGAQQSAELPTESTVCHCLPLFATVCDWWKHNQSISFRPSHWRWEPVAAPLLLRSRRRLQAALDVQRRGEMF